MARTALFGAIRRAFMAARLSARERDGARMAAGRSGLARPGMSRREFLAATALAGAAVSAPALAKRDPGKVVIVGGGIAGLNCAHRLAKGGIDASIYEASKRTGGRMWTAPGLMGPETWTELGAEFIDSNHKELRRLVREFNLDLIDFATRSEKSYEETFYFQGRDVHFDEIVDAFAPIAPRLAADLEAVGDPSYGDANPAAVALDQKPLTAYLREIGASGFLYDLIDVAYVGEYGLACEEQPALNLLFIIGNEAGDFSVYGESDERYKVRGGNQQIVDKLAGKYGDRIHREHKLEAIAPAGEGYTLTFAGPNGSAVDVAADVVVLALPFTMLRDVDVRVPLPPHKERAIQELGYGQNAKLFAGMSRRVWRDSMRNGTTYSDLPFGVAWDNTGLQPGTAGGITFYSGGAGGLAVGQGTAEERVAELLPDLDKALPGTAAAYTGIAKRMHWPSYPFVKGSYTCYRLGQWTTISGAEAEPVGNLFFAGEHCSIEFQGFMNGGAQSGLDAAQAVARKAGVR